MSLVDYEKMVDELTVSKKNLEDEVLAWYAAVDRDAVITNVPADMTTRQLVTSLRRIVRKNKIILFVHKWRGSKYVLLMRSEMEEDGRAGNVIFWISCRVKYLGKNPPLRDRNGNVLRNTDPNIVCVKHGADFILKENCWKCRRRIRVRTRGSSSSQTS